MPLQSSNIKTEGILELENRRKIFEIVKKYSGCHFREIERKSDIAHGTLKYHLNFLNKHGLIIQKKDNNTIRYFPKDFQASKTNLLSFLRQSSLRKIILYVLMNENCSHEEISRFVQLSPSTISWHLNKLLSAGVIGRKRRGRKTQYVIAIDKNEIIKLLITYKDSFLDSIVNKAIEMWELR